MKTKSLVTAVGLGLALVVATGSRADTVQINPDAGGPDPVISVGSLDWAVGNAQIRGLQVDANGVPIVGSTFQTYAHSVLSQFLNPNGVPIGGLGLNSTYEWTFVAGFQEVVTSASALTGVATFSVVPGPENFFGIFFDSSPDANPLAGTGFDDGTLILTGNAVIGNTTFQRTTPVGGPFGPLDNFTGNNYPAISSVSGNGGTQGLAGPVTFSDPSFFLTPPTIISLNFSTENVLPFDQTNPSALFYNLADFLAQGGPSVLGANVANITTCNGCFGPGEPNAGPGSKNFLLQSDANQVFVAQAPEPATLALLGIALAGLGLTSRRKRND